MASQQKLGLRTERWTGTDRDYHYRAAAHGTHLTILACMAAIGTCFFLVPTEVNLKLNALGFVFRMEWLAVWAFSAAWLTKGRALF